MTTSVEVQVVERFSVEIPTVGPQGIQGEPGPQGVPGSVSDGDKGDIVVSSAGATWTLDPTLLSTFMRSVLGSADAAAARGTFGTASATETLTNKSFDANGAGNSITNIEVADFAGSAVVTAAEGLASSNNDTSFPTTAAVKAAVDAVSSGVSDGDKGDVVVSGSGAVWTVTKGDLVNLGLAFSVASSAMTIALKQADGSTNPSSGAGAVVARMRSATAGAGAVIERQATASQSLVIPSTATMGRTSGLVGHLYHYLIDNSGALELAVSGKWFGRSGITSTTAIGTGSDSYDVMYSTTARTAVPFICIGRSIDTQTTAGTWAALPSVVEVGRVDRYRAAFKANKNNVAQALTDAVATKVTFGTEISDIGGFYDAANSKWTPPPGPVQLQFAVWCTGTYVAGTQGQASIYKNGAALCTFICYAVDTSGVSGNMNAFDVANGSDYYECYMYADTSSGSPSANGNGLWTFFTGNSVDEL